jgi:two-component system, NarL family, invasion response regulator UvrY
MSVRVIVTEVNGLQRTVLADTLREAGFEVVAACAGAREALAAASRGGADVLTTNVVMGGPEGDGYALTERLHAEHPQLPVLVLTAHDGGDHMDRARDAGAAGFLQKGADAATLAAALTRTAAGGTWFGEA